MRTNKNPSDRIKKMTTYLLSEECKFSVAKKMSGEFSDCVRKLDDLTPIRILILSKKFEAEYVAASALDLLGPMACDVGDIVFLLESHEDSQIRNYAKNVIEECNL